jgi:hypothetical protein
VERDDALWEGIIHPDDRAAAVEANRVHYERAEPLIMDSG